MATDFGFAEKNVVPKTYNGTGVIIKKNELPEGKKKDDGNIKSTVASYRTDNPKREPATNISAKKIEKPSNAEDIKSYKTKINNLEVKLEMIAEIARSAEDNDQKMLLICDVLQINNQNI